MLARARIRRRFSTDRTAVVSTPAYVIDRRARKRVKRHFKRTHWYAESSMVLGFFCVLAWFYLGRYGLYVPLGLFAFGFGLIWLQVRPWFVATQAEFDRIAEADFAYAQQVALQTFNISADDLRDEPCKFRNATTQRDIGLAFKGQKFGTDEKMRRSPHEFMIVHFGQTQLFVYGCVWDLTTGNPIETWTQECAYREIASVELSHKKQTIPVNLKTRMYLPFWAKLGVTKTAGVLQVPTSESIALRLSSGEHVPIFSWVRSSNGIPSGEGFRSYANAQRLQKLVREFRQRLPPAQPGQRAATPPAPPTIRHMRTSSS
jgi:hypothetical protein